MKFWLQIVIVIAACVLAYFLLATALGLLFWVVVAIVVVSIIGALGRAWWNERQNKRSPNIVSHKKAEKQAEAALKELERKAH